MARRPTPPALTFRAAAVRVRVPASSANLGPGFDSLGLALDWFDDLVAQVNDEPGISVDAMGEGAEDLPKDGKHLVAKAMIAAFDAMGGRPAGLGIVTANHIPHSRGLGSSSAAIAGGIALARALVVGGDQLLDNAAALRVAAKLEGHPDNVAAALLGGVTIAWGGADEAEALKIAHHPSLYPIVCIPSAAVATKKARGLLPEQVPHADAAFNAGRAALLVAALTDHPELLLTATEDRLHQDYRQGVMSASHKLVHALRERGLAAVISGAGPSVLVLATSNVTAEVAEVAGAAFETHAVGVSAVGAHTVPLDA